jgi:hypothetical protein
LRLRQKLLPQGTGINITVSPPASFRTESVVNNVSALSSLVASAKQSARERSLLLTFQTAAPRVVCSLGGTHLIFERRTCT